MCWWFFTLWALHSAPADDRCAWGIDLNPPSPQVFFKLKKPPRNLRTGVLMRPFVALLPCLPECLSRPSSLFKQLRALCPSCSDYHWNCSLPGLQFSDPLKLPGIFVLSARMFHFALASKCLIGAYDGNFGSVLRRKLLLPLLSPISVCWLIIS